MLGSHNGQEVYLRGDGHVEAEKIPEHLRGLIVDTTKKLFYADGEGQYYPGVFH